MKKRIFVSTFIVILFISCAPEQPEQDTDLVAVIPDGGELVAKSPSCGSSNSEYKAPLANSIHEPVDADSPVTFTWDLDCVPEDYLLTITHLNNEPDTVYISHFFPPNPQINEYTRLYPLEPSTYYQWKLAAIDFEGKEYEKDPGWATFRTGPLCSVENLVAPTLVSPADGTIDSGKGYGNVNEVIATIKYPVGECFPDYFEIEYSTNTSFIEEKNLNPAGVTYGKKEGEWWVYTDETTGTQNCNLYYWRSRAVVDGGFGEWSETFNFYLDVYGNCYKFPEFKGIQNANCRSDPWAGENYVSVIWEGDNAELLGLNEDASWGMFKLQNELECWVNMSMVEPDPSDAAFFPGYYPILEHGEQPDDLPEPPAGEEPAGEETPVGCMAPTGRSSTLTCQIPCPDPNYAARVCP